MSTDDYEYNFVFKANFNDRPAYTTKDGTLTLWFLHDSETRKFWYMSREVGNTHNGVFIGKTDDFCPVDVDDWLLWRKSTYTLGND